MLSLTQGAFGLASGSLVGFSLGLVGGGGSILAVPLLVYLVGVSDPHVAIGTSAIAVAANAAANLVNHARAGNVKWRCASVFAFAGVAGAFLGSTLGKIVEGQKLLALFAIVMMVVGTLMLKGRSGAGEPSVRLNRKNLPKLLALGLVTGALSGFFGIGGGFLIVPALIAATGMPILYAVGSSLVAVTAFGLTTAVNYALSGLVDWYLAALFVSGGVLGGLFGARSASSLAGRKGALNAVFAALIFAVAIYMLVRNLGFV
ncbi:sulfite exporter TauE/SafE family protein [Bradyrhizobium manausense]|uniref:sulfite exporter TauE/SafE family protein n=1 Tax=Bradyrhizobium manausense TaxID=989370 RepID=UPI001BA6EAFD|nr:sulfite exporter TauE/SafE family protein [Bradyrhizobium manausense]MBR0827169.1 sulfite exporter TauE/SafE family protein [Bradyrhizobium manausense]